MTDVKIFLVYALLDPLSGLADDEEAVSQYENLDSDNEAQVKGILRTTLLPYFERFDDSSKAELKLALRYCLTQEETRFDRIFGSRLMPFDPPSKPRRFFQWIWEVFFGAEDYRLDDLTQYRIDNEIRAPKLVAR
jgi:hypothetical protein